MYVSSLLWFLSSQFLDVTRTRFAADYNRPPFPRVTAPIRFVSFFTLLSEDCANLLPEYQFEDNVVYQAVPNRANSHC